MEVDESKIGLLVAKFVSASGLSHGRVIAQGTDVSLSSEVRLEVRNFFFL